MKRRPQIKNLAKAKGPLELRIKPVVFAHQTRLTFKGDTTLAEQVA